jgi:hypothetical protein
VASGPSGLGAARPGGGGGGGPVGAGEADPALIRYLEQNQGDATYLVAAFGAGASAPIIVATGKPVITIGGFGGDPAPTLGQLQALVAQGKVRFALVGGAGGGPGGPGGGPRGPGGGPGGPGGGRSGDSIAQWVAETGRRVPASTYGGTATGAVLYDLAPRT